ncbi:DUF3987 domain-containing protein [Flavobacteriaceae bacterium]|nr:DUF3987 domain-containing protein [Flavobacteriaceae bacterium]
MQTINYFDSVKESQLKKVDVQKVLQQIQKGYWKDQINDIRYQIQNGNSKKASEIKSNLPAITISATFKERRKKDYVDNYTGLLHLDYDKLENVEEVKANLTSIPYTYSAFISPSGNGVKVLVRSDNDISGHTKAFNGLRAYYDEIVGVESDSSVKDITRLCFVSYDCELYLNETSEVFKYKTATLDQIDLSWVWSFTGNKHDFVVGNRNNFIYSFACNANRYGVDINDTTNYAYSYSDDSFPENEIDSSIKSAYENNINEKGSVAKPASSAILVKDIPHKITSPYIPESIYDVLPPTLKEACNVFKGRERDVFFTSALSVISGGLYNVSGLYANDKVFPNLFSIIIAPPASGKGVMKFGRQLGDCSHNFLLNQSKEELKEYKKEKRVFDLKVKKAKTDQAIEALIEPEKPKAKMFFIPGNTSSAMITKHLEYNDGMGCICETEADALTNALKQEWGSFSDIIRKGFQAEIISQSRKTDLEYSEIKEPKFSLALTGTPNQLDLLMTSVQDGLFSRVLFYSFNAAPIWKTTYTSGISRSNKEIFEVYSADLCEKFKSNTAKKFSMIEEQGLKLDNIFSELLIHNTALYGEDAGGTIKRLGLMCYKIAMTLSAIRSENTEIICSDDDFNTSLYLVKEVYLIHSINMLNKVSKTSKKLNYTQTALYDWIKSKGTFKRSEISEKSKVLGIKDRTLSDILKRFIELNLIEKVSHGVYTKR